jgi:hypothetical protein
MLESLRVRVTARVTGEGYLSGSNVWAYISSGHVSIASTHLSSMRHRCAAHGVNLMNVHLVGVFSLRVSHCAFLIEVRLS